MMLFSYLDNLLHMLNSCPDSILYIILGMSAFIENVFPPAPGDMITAFGAFLVGIKRLHFIGVYLSTTIGSLSGFMFLFWVGRFLGRRFFSEKDFFCFKAQDIILAEKWFLKYGYFLILLNRFFPGIRSVISISGGILRLKTVNVALLALISACAWNLIWMYMGFSLGSNWEIVKEKITSIMAQYNMAVMAVLGILVLFFAIKRLLGRQGRMD